MHRPVVAALVIGALNAVVAVLALVLVELAVPDEFGWYAYAPLNAAVPDPRFPWRYVAVPVALVLANAMVVPAVVRRLLAPRG